MINKKSIYILAFTVLGGMFGFLLHMWIEIWYIGRLLSDFDQYSMGRSWAEWAVWHQVLVISLVTKFALLGFFSGRYWWQQIYVLKRYKKRWKI